MNRLILIEYSLHHQKNIKMYYLWLIRYNHRISRRLVEYYWDSTNHKYNFNAKMKKSEDPIITANAPHTTTNTISSTQQIIVLLLTNVQLFFVITAVYDYLN